MRKLTIGFVGLGLIGGSIAKALRQHYKDCKIIVYNRSENSRYAAVSDGVANVACDKVDERFCECDYIFLCTPVEQNVTYLSILKDIIKDDCIITDVGSVKGNIHSAVEKIGLTKNFIGGHPMTGKEKVSYFNSEASLMENAFYVLTPTDDVDPAKSDELKSIIETIGSKPVIMDYAKHDHVVAGISHLPHLIAANLVTLIKDTDDEEGYMKMLAAGGFKDITRIASSSSDMWEQICAVNTENIVELLDAYIEKLNETRAALVEGKQNYVYDLFTESREYRSLF